MIRDVVVHLNGEQPLLADIEGLPSAADACLVCTNLRLTNGRTPAFVARSDSTFLFPLVHIRFVEIPGRTLAGAGPDVAGSPASPPAPEPDLDIDEELLRRVREA